MQNLKHTLIGIALVLAVLGVLDAGYLTFEHYSDSIPPCSTSVFVDCGKVLKSKYAMMGPLPVSVMGLAYYSTMLGVLLLRLAVEKQHTVKDLVWRILEKYARPQELTLERLLFYLQMMFAVSAAGFSVYFVYLQLVVIGAICLYCMFSATLSFAMLAVTLIEYFKVHKNRLLP